MQCFVCGAEVGNSKVCYQCGADILLYRQIVYTSYVFYNQGLDKARVHDLSGAIDSLKNSLQYYKYNTRARNLLGLCYYQVGDIVHALNEWVLSKNLQEDNPDADRYLAEIENAPELLNRLNSTLKKYNQAIEYCKSGSRDLAIIQLKKVISQNPNLVKAQQLLALLYIQEERYSEARKCLVSANKIDANNTITIRYMHEVKDRLKERNTGHHKKNDVVTFADGNDTIIMSENSFRSMMDSSRSSFINILIGIVLGVLICYFLIVPTAKESAASTNSDTMVALNEELNEERANSDSLMEELEGLKKDLAKYEGSQDIATSYDNLIAARQLYDEQDYTAASQRMELVTKEVMGEAGQQAYEDTYNLLIPAMSEEYYTEGNNFYLDGNYESAIINFKNVVDMDETYMEGAALFLLADCYRLTDAQDLASEYYARVVELYPDNEWGKQAKTYIAADGDSMEAAEVE